MLEGRRVVVVGGSAGIGHAVAQAARAAGAEIAIVGRDTGTLSRAVAALGGGTRGEAADARDPAAIATALARIGRFDHLVVTASASAARLGVAKPMAEMPKAAAESFFAGKFWAQYHAAQAALPLLSADGSITFTSGVASRKGLPNHTVLAASNAAVDAMARQLAREIAPVRVNVVSPGLTDTRAYDHLAEEEKKAFFAHVTGRLPIARAASAAEIAQGYIFAMTATYLTGAVLDLDGGLLVT
ncbi:MAG: SDR family oxidoreductase [Alphaproteobacteria bacterium]|nr:SDR family oxidoreductase [Alphaproteobacteria bacterium]